MVAALIVADRMGSSDKGFQPAKPVGSISAFHRLILVFQEAGIDRIFIVGGAGQSDLEHHVARMGVVCLSAEDQDGGAGSCLAAGLDYLKDKFGRILLTSASSPLFSPATVEALIRSPGDPAVPVHEGRRGVPLFASPGRLRQMIDDLPGRESLSDLLALWGEKALPAPVEDEGVLLNLEEENDWESLMLQYRLTLLRPQIKLLVAREEIFLGPGMQQLLEILEETGSMRIACAEMGISYSKGWKMVNTMERQAGFEVVVRYKGGPTGGHSHLTPEGRDLMARYRAYAKECKAAIQPIFRKYFGKYQGGE